MFKIKECLLPRGPSNCLSLFANAKINLDLRNTPKIEIRPSDFKLGPEDFFN